MISAQFYYNTKKVNTLHLNFLWYSVSSLISELWFFSIHSHNGVSSLINEYEWPMNAQKFNIHFNRHMKLLKIFLTSRLMRSKMIWWFVSYICIQQTISPIKRETNIISEKYFLSIDEFQKWITTVRMRFLDTTYWILSFYVSTFCLFCC